MRYLVCVLVFLVCLGGVAHAASYQLEASGTCSGAAISGWDGKSRYSFSSKVYDFSVQCDGARLHIIDVFLAGADSNRYKKSGGTLYKHTGDERKSVKVRDRECVMVPERVEVDPPSSNPCYYDIMHPDCDPSRKYFETRTVERCTRAQYETRHVAKWEPFPTGYSPLPQGARIIKVAAPRNTGSTTESSGGGSNIGIIILGVILLGLAAFLYKPLARFYYSAFVPHPAKQYLDASIASNQALDTESFERAMYKTTQGPFPDVMADKGAKLRRAMDEHAEMMRSVEERERARIRMFPLASSQATQISALCKKHLMLAHVAGFLKRCRKIIASCFAAHGCGGEVYSRGVA